MNAPKLISSGQNTDCEPVIKPMIEHAVEKKDKTM